MANFGSKVGEQNEKKDKITYEIKEHLGVLSENSKGWRKEINVISWNGGNPKYDIRDWSPDHEKMGKGTGLTVIEVENLFAILKGIAEAE